MASLFSPIRWLFRTLWRLITFLRLALTNLLFVLLVALLLFTLTREEPVLAPKPGALVLNLSGDIVEQSSQPASGQLLRELLGNEDAPRELVRNNFV